MAFDTATEEILERIFTKTDPVIFGNVKSRIGNKEIFTLCQYIQGMLPEIDSHEDLKAIVERWYERYELVLEDKEGDLLSFVYVWSEFLDLWPKIEYPKHDTLYKAIKQAIDSPVPEEVKHWHDENYKMLASVCRELQRLRGAEPFFLSSYDAGKILGKSQPAAFKALKMFVAEGLLKVIKKGDRNHANYYQYLGKL